MRLELTKDELYLIERTADEQSSQASKNIYNLACKFMEIGCIELDKGVEVCDEIRKLLMKNIQEHHRAMDSWDKIRKKCEAKRKNE